MWDSLLNLALSGVNLGVEVFGFGLVVVWGFFTFKFVISFGVLFVC